MDIEIIKEKETPLLSRKRVTAWAHSEGVTPSRKKICIELSKHLKVKPELVIVRHIYTRFGVQKAKLIAHVYDDRNVLVKLEGKKLVEKHKIEQPKAEESKETKE
jgi:small subunit ribosomal protein S24e